MIRSGRSEWRRKHNSVHIETGDKIATIFPSRTMCMEISKTKEVSEEECRKIALRRESERN
jgi:ArsR family metal-binding transcriptional regulator